MTEATLVEWSLEVGQKVVNEQVVAVIETDKVTFEIPSPGDGLIWPVVEAGTTIEVGAIIGLIAKNEEELAKLQIAKTASSIGTVTETMVEKTLPTSPQTIHEAPVHNTQEKRVKASPLARRIAEEHGLDLLAIGGSGPGGRIVEADVKRELEALLKAKKTPLPGIPSGPEVDLLLSASEEIPIKGVRKAIFNNMHLSVSTQAQLTLQTEVSAQAFIELHETFNNTRSDDQPKISFNAILVKVIAQALKRHPKVNVSVEGEVIKVWSQIHVGVAMDLGSGLIVPKIRNADTKSITDISDELRQLKEKAMQKALIPDDLQGGTFTLTNLGAWGVDHFTPIINYPESAVLGVGRILEKPRATNGIVEVEPCLALSLTIDHRIIDGAPGAAFLQTLSQMIEEPGLML